MKRFKKAFEAVEAAHQAALENLAEDVRVNLIMPVCKKHKLGFLSGMGTFFFSKGNLTIASKEDALQHRMRVLIPILEVLNLEVSHGQYLGFWVGDVKED